jgi:uncharacterized protein
MSDPSTRGNPVSSSERILFIDVLRGVALFGILAANMRAFFAPLDIYENINALFHGHGDRVAQGFIDIFIQGKFITLFSFMFGLGFAIQMSRAEARGARFMGFYPRRLLALAVFGLIHGILIWAGDILLTYAFAGALLLLFRKRQQKTLLWWAGGLVSVPILVNGVFFALYLFGVRFAWLVPKPPDMKKIHAIIDVYAHGTVRQILVQNWVEWKHTALFALFGAYLLTLFLLGMWVWRAGIVQRLSEYRPLLKRVCLWCLPIGILLNAYTAVVFALAPQNRITYWAWSAVVLNLPSAHLLSAGYASGLALIFLSGRWHAVLGKFAAVGRMALTNYLMQSVVCTLFFYHYTTGLYGRVGPAWGLLATVILFTAQIALSNWWLARYSFGPMEWLWRGLTYGKFPSMTREEPAPELPAAGQAAMAQTAATGPSSVPADH